MKTSGRISWSKGTVTREKDTLLEYQDRDGRFARTFGGDLPVFVDRCDSSIRRLVLGPSSHLFAGAVRIGGQDLEGGVLSCSCLQDVRGQDLNVQDARITVPGAGSAARNPARDDPVVRRSDVDSPSAPMGENAGRFQEDEAVGRRHLGNSSAPRGPGDDAVVCCGIMASQGEFETVLSVCGAMTGSRIATGFGQGLE